MIIKKSFTQAIKKSIFFRFIEFMKLVKENTFFKTIIWLVLLITAIGFLIDLQSTFIYIGTDLRNRVVGARLVIEGIDPYFFKWTPSLSERFCDPLDDPNSLLSRVSVPPTVLALHSTMARLPYVQQKILWLIVQWSAFIGTIFTFLLGNKSHTKANFILTISFFLPIVYFGVFT